MGRFYRIEKSTNSKTVCPQTHWTWMYHNGTLTSLHSACGVHHVRIAVVVHGNIFATGFNSLSYLFNGFVFDSISVSNLQDVVQTQKYFYLVFLSRRVTSVIYRRSWTTNTGLGSLRSSCIWDIEGSRNVSLVSRKLGNK